MQRGSGSCAVAGSSVKPTDDDDAAAAVPAVGDAADDDEVTAAAEVAAAPFDERCERVAASSSQGAPIDHVMGDKIIALGKVLATWFGRGGVRVPTGDSGVV